MYLIYQNMLNKFSVIISPSINCTYCHYNQISSQCSSLRSFNACVRSELNIDVKTRIIISP